MISRLFLSSLAFTVALTSALTSTAEVSADITPAQRKEIAAISRELTKTSGLIRRKKAEDAATALDAIEQRIKDLGLPADERAAMGIRRQLQLQRANVARLQNPGGAAPQGVSFEKDVAPILKGKCLRCHGDDARGGLRLSTFAGMEAGGSSGPLVFRGSPQRSLLMARLIAPANQRMPRNGEALSREELTKISQWIAAGAKFDGSDKNAEIGTGRKEPLPEVKIERATGDETVSFSRDIAPFMTNLCLRCHSGNNARSGFSLETFEKLMQGGDSGRVVIPGNLDGSRLWDLAGKQDPIKMPPGQALLTRTNWENLQTWIEEGARFDGEDAKSPIRSLVPTEAEMRTAELEELSPEEFVDYRLERSEATWKQVFPKERARFVEARETIVFGNVAADRLTQISDWAEAQTKQLKSLFNDKGTPAWKGKLTIFVVKDRFGFEEFNLVAHKRQTPTEIAGHAEVSANYSEAYIVLQDVGDEPDEANRGMLVNLVENLSSAYLMRGGQGLPEWLMRGTGLMIAARTDKDNAYLKGLPLVAVQALQNVSAPEDVFADDTFAPSDVGPVGYSLVEFMLKAGGPAKLTRFVASLQAGNNLSTAAQTAYRADLRALGTAFISAVRR